jgi:hypothetical protein
MRSAKPGGRAKFVVPKAGFIGPVSAVIVARSRVELTVAERVVVRTWLHRVVRLRASWSGFKTNGVFVTVRYRT